MTSRTLAPLFALIFAVTSTSALAAVEASAVILSGELVSGSAVPVDLAHNAGMNPLSIDPAGLLVHVGAGADWEPGMGWPPYWGGKHRFAGVYFSQGVLLINLPNGQPFPVGRLQPNGNGFRPVLDAAVSFRLVDRGVELVITRAA